MKRQKSDLLTPSVAKLHVKELFRGVFVALRADMKHRDGGASAVADECGFNAVVLNHKLSPDYRDDTPTLEQFLTVIERGECKRAVAAVAALVGQAAIDVPAGDVCPKSVIAAFMALLAQAGKLTAQGATDLADGRLDAAERERQAAMLDELIPAAVQYRAVLRS